MTQTPAIELTRFALGLVAGNIVSLVVAASSNLRGPAVASCATCFAPTRWFELLLPCGSWLSGLRCPRCGARRPFRDPIIVSGFAVAAVFVRDPAVLLMLALIALVALCDLVSWTMPFRFTIPGSAIAIALGRFLPAGSIGGAALGAVVVFGGVFAVERGMNRLSGREAFGGGVKFFLAMVAATLGLRWMPAFAALLVIQLAVAATLLMLTRKRASMPTQNEVAVADEDGFEDPGMLDGEPREVDPFLPLASMTQLGPYIGLSAMELMLFPQVLPHWLVPA